MGWNFHNFCNKQPLASLKAFDKASNSYSRDRERMHEKFLRTGYQKWHCFKNAVLCISIYGKSDKGIHSLVMLGGDA